MEVMQARAALYQQVRDFFARRGVQEVFTPIFGSASATDPHLSSFTVDAGYLQTSPEFPMKRMLAAGSGPIFQIASCFRQNEASKRHNPEFTMLEWYRPGFTFGELMAEVAELVEEVLAVRSDAQRRYADCFERQLGINPHSADVETLAGLARDRLDFSGEAMERSDWLDLLMSHVVEPTLGLEGGEFVVDFPCEQAALSRIDKDEDGNLVAKRFELYLAGVEIANGYDELLDADELQRRFEADNVVRLTSGMREVSIDKNLLAAHRAGLPACCGVALGLDRLLMHKLGARSIQDVLAFPADRV